MTATATHILEEFKRLTPAEKREVLEAIVREATVPPQSTGARPKTIAEIAGKYRSSPETAGEDLDTSLVKAILESKQPPGGR